MTPAQSDVIADRLLELGVAPGMVERVRLALDLCTLLVPREDAALSFIEPGVPFRGAGEQVAAERIIYERCSVSEKALLRSLRAQAVRPLGIAEGTEEWHQARIAAANMGLR